MQIEIHDVDHGGCAVITSPSGHRLMIDCGKSATRGWSPSAAYRSQRFEALMVQNLDLDHVEDFERLVRDVPIEGFFSNPTITATDLALMKGYDLRGGLQTAHDVLQHCGPCFGTWDHALGGVRWKSYWNRYGLDFTNTNNLSLATFVIYGNFTILFGGDLETEGWRKLLQILDFRLDLLGVNVLVASHHGRENGCCPELFNWCNPELIIFSDGPKQHSTQETDSWYRARAKGIVDRTKTPDLTGTYPLRKVMTTRKDGTIRINAPGTGTWTAYRNPRPEPDFGVMLEEIFRNMPMKSRILG